MQMPDEFGSNDNLNMPYSEGQAFGAKKADGLITNTSNRFKRKNDKSGERSHKEADLSKDNSQNSLKLKRNQVEPKQFSG